MDGRECCAGTIRDVSGCIVKVGAMARGGGKREGGGWQSRLR